MTRLVRFLFAAVSAATLVAACRQYLPSNRYLQLRQPATRRGTADARGKFNHATHTQPFKAAGVTCIDCHRFDARIDTADEALAQELSAQAQYPGGAACHHCHVVAESRVATAPGACNTCHDNLEPLRPADHDVAWLKVHASAAHTDPIRCENCHRQSYCIDCHARRDTIQTRVHERNFRFIHSVQVRANPMQCGSCHREDFCVNCHQQGKVEIKP